MDILRHKQDEEAERHLHQRNVAALRERLDPETLAARWTEGWTLDWEEAVELALRVEAEPGGTS